MSDRRRAWCKCRASHQGLGPDPAGRAHQRMRERASPPAAAPGGAAESHRWPVVRGQPGTRPALAEWRAAARPPGNPVAGRRRRGAASTADAQAGRRVPALVSGTARGAAIGWAGMVAAALRRGDGLEPADQGVRVQGDAGDAPLDQEAGELRIVARRLAADADLPAGRSGRCRSRRRPSPAPPGSARRRSARRAPSPGRRPGRAG